MEHSKFEMRKKILHKWLKNFVTTEKNMAKVKMSTNPPYFGLSHDLRRSFLSSGRNKKIADQEQGTKPWTKSMLALQAKSIYLGT